MDAPNDRARELLAQFEVTLAALQTEGYQCVASVVNYGAGHFATLYKVATDNEQHTLLDLLREILLSSAAGQRYQEYPSNISSSDMTELELRAADKAALQKTMAAIWKWHNACHSSQIERVPESPEQR